LELAPLAGVLKPAWPCGVRNQYLYEMKIVLFANTAWYLYNFRRSLALELTRNGHDVLLLSPDDAYGEKLRELGLLWESVPMDRRSLNPFREALVLIHLAGVLRKYRPDIVHSFTIKCAVYGSLAARLASVPRRVNAVAGMGYVFVSQSLKAKLLRPIVRALLRLSLGGRNASLILQNPDDVALFQQARLVDSDQIRLIPGSGVDCDRFFPDPLHVAGRRQRVLLPARLLWDKGLAEYAEAARLLRQRDVPVDLLLAGEPDPGNPAAVPVAAVRKWVNEGVLEWLGHVDDMPALFRGVDIVALPSYREGLPKGLIEAGACGCALVATDVAGCREVVEHGVDGLRVPVKDGRALANAIESLVLNPDLRVRLGRAARQKILDRFDERIINARTLAVYAEQLSQ
jgi:glycosyltransferase involved in cell wall biosynthesis